MITEGCPKYEEIVSRGIPRGDEADFTAKHIMSCSRHAAELVGMRGKMEEVFGIVEEVGKSVGMTIDTIEGPDSYGLRLERMHAILHTFWKRK